MLHEPGPSDSPDEEALRGSPSAEAGSAHARTSPDAGETSPEMSESTVSLEGAPSPGVQDRGRTRALAAMGILVAMGIALIVASPRAGGGETVSAAVLTAASGETAVTFGTKEAKSAVADAGAPSVRPPPAWRVASMKGDLDVEVIEGTFSKRGFVATLSQVGVPRAQIRRVLHAFEGVRRIDRPRDTDTFVVAKDKNNGTVLAFEYATSPLDIWQMRASGNDGNAVVRKVELFVEHRRIAQSFVVTADLAKAISSAGMRPEIVEAVGDALEGHVDPSAIRAGVRMRLVATEDWVEGAFVRTKLEAVEFMPQSGTPLRLYYYARDPSSEASARRAPAPGFYDAKARQPIRGQFRSPLAFARVTSRFNPKRLHPVLKVVSPHNGVDFGGATGTPVYAAGAGTVVSAGNGGPCGNMVQISHSGGITTAYCHLKGFAQGLRAGQKVEVKQLIGYVGQTGRVTGPHLHFAVKKNGVFIDPLGLKMDAVRVLPPSDRETFGRARVELDAVLDGISLPSAGDVSEENEEKDLHAD